MHLIDHCCYNPIYVINTDFEGSTITYYTLPIYEMCNVNCIHTMLMSLCLACSVTLSKIQVKSFELHWKLPMECDDSHEEFVR